MNIMNELRSMLRGLAIFSSIVLGAWLITYYGAGSLPGIQSSKSATFVNIPSPESVSPTQATPKKSQRRTETPSDKDARPHPGQTPNSAPSP
jgi:hypothetical protein